jgi:HPt (histidine-containing phosphotransfer) domain-containing protein
MDEISELIDLSFLKKHGGNSYIQLLTPIFIKSVSESIVRVRNSYDEKDFKELSLVLHKLIGTFNTVGATVMSLWVRSLKNKVDNGLENLEDYIEKLQDQFTKIKNVLISSELKLILE